MSSSDPKLTTGGGGGDAPGSARSTAGSSDAGGGLTRVDVIGIVVQFVTGLIVGAVLDLAAFIDSGFSALATAIGTTGDSVSTSIAAVGAAVGGAYATAVDSVARTIGVGPNLAGAIVATAFVVGMFAIGIRFGEALVEALLVALGAIPVVGDLVVATITLIVEFVVGDPG